MKNYVYFSVPFLAFISTASSATLWTTSLQKSASASDISSVSLVQTGSVPGVTGSVTSLVSIDTTTGDPVIPSSVLSLNTTVRVDAWNQSFLPNAYIIVGTTGQKAQGWQSEMAFAGAGNYLIDSLTLTARDVNIPTGGVHQGGTSFMISLSIIDSMGGVLGTTTQAITFINPHVKSGNFTFSFDEEVNVNMKEGFKLQMKVYDGGVGAYKNLNLTQGLGVSNVAFNGVEAPQSVPEPSTTTLALASLSLLSLRRRK